MNSGRFLAIICACLLAGSTYGSDLYLATVGSQADIDAIIASEADPILRVNGGYLLLLTDTDMATFQEAGLTLTLVTENISRDELAVDTRFDPNGEPDQDLVFEEDRMRVVRISSDQGPNGLAEGGLRSLKNLRPSIRLPESRRFTKSPFFDSPDLDAVVNQISQDSLHSYMSELQSRMVRRAGTAPNIAARDWIQSKLIAFGCDSVVLQPFDAYVAGSWMTCYNVLGYKTGTITPNKYLIAGAHFDAVPGSPGADDNGSGTAAVLEMARVFCGMETDLTMVFALFDAEEYGLWGSEYYAAQAAGRGDDIEYMLNLDMVAHFQNYGEAKLFHGPETAYSLLFQSISEPLVGISSYLSGSSSGSDHFYFIQYGYEATFLHEMTFSTVYHSFQDSTSYMNFDYFERMTKASLATLFVIDNGVMFSADVLAGQRPLSVGFSSWTLDPPSAWNWDFGDGGTDNVPAPSHTYNTRGIFTVSLDVTANGIDRGLQRGNYIAVLDDTLMGISAQAPALDTVEIVVEASHIIPLRQIEIPVEFAGDLALTYVTFSTVGCRTEGMNNQSIIHLDPFNNRFTIRLQNTAGEQFNVPPGSGPILKLYYYNSEPTASDHTAEIIFDGYSTHMPIFSGPIATYQPTALPSLVISGCCANFRGNVNGDGLDAIDISDLTYLVAYMFKSGPSAPCPSEANVNGIDQIDIADLTMLVSYMFKSGAAPASCN